MKRLMGNATGGGGVIFESTKHSERKYSRCFHETGIIRYKCPDKRAATG